MTSAIDALQSRQRVREIAAAAKADERTVRRVLHGNGPKNAAYERVMEAMASTSTEPPRPPVFAKFGELGEREVEFSEDGSSIGIYVLVDPRDQTVRYVGATEKASKRLSNHMVERSGAMKMGWIAELRELNLRPTLVTIEYSARETAHLVEEKWIAAYLEIGDLYNQKDSGYQFRRQHRLSMERFRGKSFASLSSDEYFILGFAKVAKVRVAAIRNFLAGQEVWPKTYENIRKASDEIGIVDLPEPAERAARRPPPRPCAACAAKDVELERARAHLVEQMQDWKRQWRDACAQRDAALANLGDARSRIAELEAPSSYPVTPSTDPACEHIGEGPSRPVPAERVVRVPPEPRAPALIGQIETRRGVQGGRPCIAGTRITVETFQALARDGHDEDRILALYPYLDMEDVRAALVYQEPPRPAPRPRECHVRILMPGEELAPDGTVTTPAEAAG